MTARYSSGGVGLPEHDYVQANNLYRRLRSEFIWINWRAKEKIVQIILTIIRAFSSIVLLTGIIIVLFKEGVAHLPEGRTRLN